MQKSGWWMVVAATLALGLAACAWPPRDAVSDAQARGAILALQRGDWRALDPQLSPIIARDPQLHQKLEQVRAYLPVEAPRAMKLVQSQRNAVFGTDAGKTSSQTYLASYPSRTVLVNVVFDRRGPAPTIIGLHVVPVDERLAEANRFGAPGKSARQYGFLAACLLSPLLMILAAIAAIRTPALEMRWLWAIIAFAGLGTVMMDWTSGAVQVNWFAVNLIGASVTRALPPLTPWILRMTLPLGAVVTLARVWSLRRRAAD
jgi:hypothetical protein